MPIISVITAVYRGGHRYLREAYDSLVKQALPDGWEWQWCLQEDGDSGEPLAELPPDSRISYGTGLPARTAVARTMALARARGSLVRTFDADDLLLPDALRRDITALRDFAWCTSACVDLLPDGTTEPGPYDPPDGPVTPGRFFEEHRENRLSVQAVTFAAHTGLVRALGGWPALTGAETDGLLLAAEAVSNGRFIAEPSLLYRKHSAQTTASARYWHDPEPRAAAVRQRAAALHKSGWRWQLPD
ncbi:glycosyltransferase [Amycolatopsis sp. 195334CR]|uniref:glycosyltransferase n=1 Tax=Amycolatopsis sp. 195334CR TaxID=2814588 RepID=UPI001A8BFA04|nr:glycosyltransferase [Amycolatopsis sp. 195334CR]MBN6038991.1 glycosyltransferase [Amycolatopsis sp. 195334CR]